MKRNQNRKNSGSKSGSSILVNKSESNAVAAVAFGVEVVNHFEEILPKDDLEIKKHKEETVETANKANKKEAKKGW